MLKTLTMILGLQRKKSKKFLVKELAAVLAASRAKLRNLNKLEEEVARLKKGNLVAASLMNHQKEEIEKLLSTNIRLIAEKGALKLRLSQTSTCLPMSPKTIDVCVPKDTWLGNVTLKSNLGSGS
jgi:hypothetical protein